MKLISLLAPALALRATGFYKITPSKPTVAAALAGFQKVKNDLLKVKEHHDAEAAKHLAAISAAAVAQANAEAEAIAAARALAKVEDFLS